MRHATGREPVEKPVARQLGYALQSTGFLEQVCRARNDRDLHLVPHLRGGVLIHLDHWLIVSTDDQQGRRRDVRKTVGSQVRTSAPRHHSLDCVALIGGGVAIATAVVGAALGVLLLLALEGDFNPIEPGPLSPPADAGWQPDASDEAVLGEYFDLRFSACMQGLTAEWPSCELVFEPSAQAAWLQQHGYGSCRQDGGSAGACVLLLPGW